MTLRFASLTEKNSPKDILDDEYRISLFHIVLLTDSISDSGLSVTCVAWCLLPSYVVSHVWWSVIGRVIDNTECAIWVDLFVMKCSETL